MTLYDPQLNGSGLSRVFTFPASVGSVTIKIAANNNQYNIKNATGWIFQAWFYIPPPVNPSSGDSCYTGVTTTGASWSNANYGVRISGNASLTAQAYDANYPTVSGNGTLIYLTQSDLFPLLAVAASATPVVISWGSFTHSASFNTVIPNITFNYKLVSATK